MLDFISDAVAILLACLVIAAFASALVVFRPAARRRRRRKRHSPHSRIDLFVPTHAETAGERDA